MTFLERAKGTVAAALPKHLNPDRMLRLAVTCFSTTPALRECTGISILSSIITASQLGLEPGIAGQGYLIPYNAKDKESGKWTKVCTFIPGWQGLVGLLNNSGRATAWTGAVFEGDEWDFQLGSNPHCHHRPGPNFGDQDKIRWVYACGKVNGSEQPVVEAWPIERIWRHRDKLNKQGDAHYSFRHPEMYARKIVLLQVLKYMPRSIELNNAMTISNSDLGGRPSKMEDGIVIEQEEGDIDDAPQKGITEKPLPKRKAAEQQQQSQEPAQAAAAPQETPAKPEAPQTATVAPQEPDIPPIERLKAKMQAESLTARQIVQAVVNSKIQRGAIQPAGLDNFTPKTIETILTNWPDFLTLASTLER